MKTFEEELKRAIYAATYTPGTDDGSYKGGFIKGLEHAQELLDIHRGAAINEILKKYHDWVAINVRISQFIRWQSEEGDKEKTKARIRKEFIEFLKREG